MPSPTASVSTITPADKKKDVEVDKSISGAAKELRDKSENVTEPEGADELSASKKIIDMDIFNQVLEMDDDDDEFSRELVISYLTQAMTTMKEMDTALAEKDLDEVSRLGHFLKGSSASLGIIEVQATCEKMQHFGKLRDEENQVDLTESEAMIALKPLLPRVRKEYVVAEKWFKNHFGDLEIPPSET